MMDQAKMGRRLSRAGQAILRKRGGFHKALGYKRIRKQEWKR